ncbi:unnamed protein product [Prorocentrum cordatum]|uniref:RNA helicase n=1 Tax=Prorocentrum cordatum TaxID=2364126 RepID=A0ABN9VAS6_9DINO|nr:unnamed protein product [Polarella glacialis]
MQELLRWEEAPPELHLRELQQFDEFNYYPPASGVWLSSASGACRRRAGSPRGADGLVWGREADRDGDDGAEAHGGGAAPRPLPRLPGAPRVAGPRAAAGARPGPLPRAAHVARGVGEVRPRGRRLPRSRTPMNAYDVLKCSQACFHLFEWLCSRLPLFAPIAAAEREAQRPPRQVGTDMRAFLAQQEAARPGGAAPGPARPPWPAATPPADAAAEVA